MIRKLSFSRLKLNFIAGEKYHSKNGNFVLRQEPDKRMAFVQLGAGETFKWPDMTKEKPGEGDKVDKQMKESDEKRKIIARKQWDRQDLPSWFR